MFINGMRNTTMNIEISPGRIESELSFPGAAIAGIAAAEFI